MLPRYLRSEGISKPVREEGLDRWKNPLIEVSWKVDGDIFCKQDKQ